jgi:hypothetical protein
MSENSRMTNTLVNHQMINQTKTKTTKLNQHFQKGYLTFLKRNDNIIYYKKS